MLSSEYIEILLAFNSWVSNSIQSPIKLSSISSILNTWAILFPTWLILIKQPIYLLLLMWANSNFG